MVLARRLDVYFTVWCMESHRYARVSMRGLAVQVCAATLFCIALDSTGMFAVCDTRSHIAFAPPAFLYSADSSQKSFSKVVFAHGFGNDARSMEAGRVTNFGVFDFLADCVCNDLRNYQHKFLMCNHLLLKLITRPYRPSTLPPATPTSIIYDIYYIRI